MMTAAAGPAIASREPAVTTPTSVLAARGPRPSSDGGNRYLVLGLGTGPDADIAVPPGRDELIAYGPLLSDDGAAWLGTAVLLRAPGPDAARAVLTAGRYAVIEVHRWQSGGRAS